MNQQSVIDAAKAPLIAYNNKDWKAFKATVTPDFTYDEVGTRRKTRGAEETIKLFQGWEAALPDSKAVFDRAFVSDNHVILEVTWRGTHKGTLETPDGPIAPTGKSIDVRACQIIEVAGGKAKSCRQYFDMATMMQQLGVPV